MPSDAVRSITGSILTHQARRSLRVFQRAQDLHGADVQAGAVGPRPYSSLSALERAEYLARAEAQIAAPPQFEPRDETICRDQVTREERQRAVTVGGAHV